jgi:uncharacterized protein
MLVLDDVVIYSASDLAAAARCEYALLRAFDSYLGRGPEVVADDDLLARTAKLGDAHEQRHLDQLRARLDENPTIIPRPPSTHEALTAAVDATREAVQRRAPAVVQAAMFDGRFLGFADFLVLDGDAYRLRDTKLARSVKVTPLLQLAAYVDVLGRDGVPIHDGVELALGNGAVVSFITPSKNSRAKSAAGAGVGVTRAAKGTPSWACKRAQSEVRIGCNRANPSACASSLGAKSKAGS